MTSLVESERVEKIVKKSPQSPFYSKKIESNLCVVSLSQMCFLNMHCVKREKKLDFRIYLIHIQQCTWLHGRLVTVIAN